MNSNINCLRILNILYNYAVIISFCKYSFYNFNVIYAVLLAMNCFRVFVCESVPGVIGLAARRRRAQVLQSLGSL